MRTTPPRAATDSDLEEAHAAESGPASRPTARGRLRRAGLPILLAVLLLAVGASWALASPIGASPDDDFHLGSIWCSSTAPDDVCVPGRDDVRATRIAQIPVVVAREATVCFAGDPTQSAACQPRPQETGELAQTRANKGAYPSGFYELMGIFASSRGAVSVLTMRLVAWIAVMSIVAASVALLPASRRSGSLIAFAATSVPMGVFIYASTNPSSFVVAGTFAYATGLMAAWWSTTPRRRVASTAVAVLAAAMALVSRPDAPVFVIAATVAVAVLCWPLTRTQRLPLAIAAAVSAVSVALYLSSTRSG